MNKIKIVDEIDAISSEISGVSAVLSALMKEDVPISISDALRLLVGVNDRLSRRCDTLSGRVMEEVK